MAALRPTLARPLATACMKGPGEGGDDTARVSVSGLVYGAEGSAPSVTLFTKYQCTLCDKVKDVLVSVKDSNPHSLTAVDISDPDNKIWWDRYKYDIPVLHIGGKFWAKHRLDATEAVKGLTEARDGAFKERKGEPNAAAMEHKGERRERRPSANRSLQANIQGGQRDDDKSTRSIPSSDD